MNGGSTRGGLVFALLLLAQTPLVAQIDGRKRVLPLGPNRPAGEAVAPFFDVWYTNPDGTNTLSFGYYNFNTEETLEIPLGPNNRIEPAEFDGMQPTYFPGPGAGGMSMAPRNAGYERHERGVFTLTVPPDFANGRRAIIWTLTAHGETHKVEARVGPSRVAMELDYGPRALGSVPPLLSFQEGGSTGQHPTGITLDGTLNTSVGEPLALTVWVSDPSERDPEIVGPLLRVIPIGIKWFKHQGPVGSEVTFARVGEPWSDPAEKSNADEKEYEMPRFQHLVAPSGGQATTRATFSEPGDYVVRVRADNFQGSWDSTAADQCCWTNGYLKVLVTQ